MNNNSEQAVEAMLLTKPLTPRQQQAYALPIIGASFLVGPIAVVTNIYAIYFGVTLAMISAVVLIARLFDAFTDPLIGYFSDRCYARSGNRKPFVVCGGALMILSGYFLYVPVNPYTIDDATSVSGLYFLSCFLIFYFSYTLFEVPHLAWASDIAISTNEKNGLFAWRSAMMFISSMLFYCVPFLPIFDSHEITPETLLWSVLIGAVLFPIALYFNIKTVPGGRTKNVSEKMAKDSSGRAQRLGLAMLLKNRPLQLFLVTFLVQGLAAGIQASVVFIYINNFLGVGEHIAPLSIAMLGSSALGLRLWYLLAARLGKKVTWSLGVSVYCLGLVLMGTLVPNGVNLHQLYVGVAILGLGMSAGSIIAPSMLSDIVNYSHWKFKASCSASFFALYNLVNKGNIAIGISLGFLLLGGFGFDLDATQQSPESIWGLRLVIAWLPVALSLLSIVLITLLPIHGRRYSIIRRRLNTELSDG